MSSTATLNQIIDQLSREKGIDASIIVSALEDAMLVATRKYYKSTEDLKAQFNKDNGSVKVFAVKKAVEEVLNPIKEISLNDARQYNPTAEIDSEVLIPKPTDVLGRIAAQTAKQVIFQKVREAERETVYGEYSGRVGECVNCTVKRIEGPDLIVDLGKTEGRLPRKEQSRLESFEIGERVRVVILKVDKAAKGPQVIVSRADSTLVTRLFEMEVPEIYDSTVVIKACAREAGERTKIAVLSRDRDVDCVGACVGLKGMRVESIRRELRGEKIDIVEHSEDAVVFATHALSPAKISRVTVLDAATKHLEVIVDDTQLSLAIGKKGQNVRLAAKLMGWKIDIKSEEEKRQEVERQMSQLVDTGTPLSELKGITDSLREKLTAAGVTSIEKLGEMTGDDLENIPGVGPKMVEKISAAVQNFWEGTETAAAADAETPSEASETAVTPEAKSEASGAEESAVASPESGDAVRPDGTEPESSQPQASSSDAGSKQHLDAPASGHAESEQGGSKSTEAETAKEN